MIIARIAAGEYVNFLYETVENFNPSDEEIKNIIKDYTKLTNIVSSIILGASLISTVVLYYLKLNKKKSYLSLEVQIYDSTENKQNLYD
jgi:CRISPR/Cas system CMR-associated protein Cmr5 small subunit